MHGSGRTRLNAGFRPVCLATIVASVCCAAPCAAAGPAAAFGGASRGGPPPGSAYTSTLPSDEGLPLFDPRSMPTFTSRTVPPGMPAAYRGEPSGLVNAAGGSSQGGPPPGAAYFPTLPSDAGLPLFDPRSMPSFTSRTVPPGVPAGYRGEPSGPTSGFGGRADSPDSFRASVLSPPSSPAYFPTMPADYAGSSVPYTGPASGMPGSLASYQQPFQSSIPEPPSPYSAAPSPGMVDSPTLRQRLRPGAPGWGAALDFMMLTDGHRSIGPVLVRQGGLLGPPLISSGDLKGTYGLGARTTLTRIRSEITEFEVSYFGIYDWTRDATTHGNNNLTLAGPVALATFDYFNADTMTVYYETNLHNLEANWLQMFVGETRKWVVGFRYLNFEETLGIQSFDADSGTSDMRVDASNDLLGFQAGVNQSIEWGLGLTMLKLRGGLLHNMASQDTLINDLNNTFVLRDVGASDSDLATLGELGISHTFSPTDSIDFRLGYNMIWIEGLARASTQVDLSDNGASSTAIFMDGSAFLHGASAGLSMRW